MIRHFARNSLKISCLSFISGSMTELEKDIGNLRSGLRAVETVSVAYPINGSLLAFQDGPRGWASEHGLAFILGGGGETGEAVIISCLRKWFLFPVLLLVTYYSFIALLMTSVAFLLTCFHRE